MDPLTSQIILTILVLFAIGLMLFGHLIPWTYRRPWVFILLAMLVKRADNIGDLTGQPDAITAGVSDAATYLALFAVILAYSWAYARKTKLSRLEWQRRIDQQAQIEALEATRRGARWDDENLYIMRH